MILSGRDYYVTLSSAATELLSKGSQSAKRGVNNVEHCNGDHMFTATGFSGLFDLPSFWSPCCLPVSIENTFRFVFGQSCEGDWEAAGRGVGGWGGVATWRARPRPGHIPFPSGLDSRLLPHTTTATIPFFPPFFSTSSQTKQFINSTSISSLDSSCSKPLKVFN